MILTVALFGEAEKGELHVPYLCRSLSELADQFGQPPPESRGLFLAVQALLYRRHLLFFRVKEEGFSRNDYFKSVHFLEDRLLVPELSAICTPGVGDSEVLDALTPICTMHASILITTVHDFYDYLTAA